MLKIVAIPVLALLAAVPQPGMAGDLYDAVLLGDAGAVREQMAAEPTSPIRDPSARHSTPPPSVATKRSPTF